MQSCTRQPIVKRDKCSSVNFLGHWANSCFSCSCFTIWTGAIHHISLEISWARHYSIEVKYENQRQAFCKYRARDWNWESYWFRLCGHASWIHVPHGSFDFLHSPKGRPPAFNCSHPGAFILLFPAVSALCIYLYQRHYGDSTGWKLFKSGLKYSVQISHLRNRDI